MILYYLKHNYTVHYICKKHNLINFELFFEKNLNLSIISVKDDNEAYIYIDTYKNLYTNILKSGVHCSNGTNLNSFPFFQYDDIQLSRNILKQYFNIPDTSKSNDLYELIKNYSYIVVNNQSSGGTLFNIDLEFKKHNINPEKFLIINTHENYYKEDHIYFPITQHFVFQKLIDYKKILIHASNIFITDSSMFCLTIQLELKYKQHKLYIRDNNSEWNNVLQFYDNKFIILN